MRHIKSVNSFNFFSIPVLSLVAMLAGAEPVSQFTVVEQSVFSAPYQSLPQYPVKKSMFGAKSGKDNQLLAAARRTLVLEEDLFDFPNGQKLLQANGICFSGTWEMNANSPFTGLYRPLLQVPVIARISVSLGGTRQKDKRALGIAIKLFPEAIPGTAYRTYNIFLMHNMAGVKTNHVLDLDMDNEPPIGGLPGLSSLGTALRLLKDLETADKEHSHGKANARFRPVSHLAKHAVSQDAIAPMWLRISVADNTPRIAMDDFRDELRLEHYPGKTLRWKIEAAQPAEQGKNKAIWQDIGQMLFTRSVTSLACDSKLHFKHPVLQE